MKKKNLFIIVFLISVFFVVPKATLASSDVNYNVELVANSTTASSKDCSTLLGEPTDNTKPAYYLVIAFKVIRYVAIILLIILTIMDFIGPITSQDQNAIKKAASKAVKRLVFCIIIWILPSLLSIFLEWFNELGMSSGCLEGF